jgi:UPF0755 protein
MKLLKILSIIFGVIVFVVAVSFIIVLQYLNQKNITPEKNYIKLPYGSSTAKIIEIFNEEGYLKPKWFFELYLKIQYKSKKKFIEAGTYEIPPEITNKELIEKLFSDDLLSRNKITIVEGFNIYEVARAFKHYLHTDSLEVIKLLTSKEFAKSLGLNSPNLEGYIMPETYFFDKETSLQDILGFLVNAQKQILKSIIGSSTTNLTEYDILKIASIIQAETSVVDEMPIISSVYQNRLKLGMLLQADPTLLYPFFPQKNITKAILNTNTPYNTYLHKGLPPTPINSPGKQAIYSAVHPALTNYLYFVAKGDSTKTHNFSTNFYDHTKNVKKYKFSKLNE